MKKLIVLFTIIALFAACDSNQPENKTVVEKKETISNPVDPNVFGKKIEITKAADSRRLPSLLESTNEVNINLIGKVSEVCQMSGCWLNIPVGDNQYVHVTFKDEAFVVPKDLAGKMVLIEGTATSELLSVELQKKAAKAEGLSQKEIDAITTPVTEYYYEATGLVIK